MSPKMNEHQMRNRAISRIVGQNILILRTARRWTLADLAGEITGVGGVEIPSSTLSKMEHGQTRVDVDQLAALCRVFGGIRPSVLMTPLPTDGSTPPTAAPVAPPDTADMAGRLAEQTVRLRRLATLALASGVDPDEVTAILADPDPQEL